MKILLLPFLAALFTLSLHAQDDKKAETVSLSTGDSVRNSIVKQLNPREDVIIEKTNSPLLSVRESNMATTRKKLDCPDIFAPPPPKPQTPPIDLPAPIEPKPEIKQPVKGKPFFLPDPVFFRINKYVIDAQEWAKIELAVNYLNENPGSTVVVTGYADKKTGNASINLRLSEQRSNAVAQALETKYGINRNRISVNWKGDGLQPFQLENDKNRAVLFLINP